MDLMRRFMMAGNSGVGIWTETIIPEIAYSTNSDPIDFGTLFIAVHGRSPHVNESAAFRLIPGNFRGHTRVADSGGGIDPVWRLGYGWSAASGRRPKQMKLIIEGNQYATGGVGLRNHGPRTTVNLLCDGGSIISLVGTEDFIQPETPLLIEGGGGLYAGGGGGVGCSHTSNVGANRDGGAGGGYPVRYWGGLNQMLLANTLRQNGTSGSSYSYNGVYYGNTGIGGSTGYYGGLGVRSPSAPQSFSLGFSPGEPGVIFEFGQGDSRFQNASGILGCINLSNYTGIVNGTANNVWKAGFAAMVNHSLFGYKNTSFDLRKYILGNPLNEYPG